MVSEQSRLKISLAFRLGHMMPKDRVWVSQIRKECIFCKEGCVIDYRQKILRMFMHPNANQRTCLQFVIDRSVKIPEFTEMLIPGRMKRQPGHSLGNCRTYGFSKGKE